MLRKILIGLAIVFVLIQFIRPEKNQSAINTHAIEKKYNVPPEVGAILNVACYDCHSNYTRYPWYANVQPAAWWLASHVKNGKKHLNFSEFTNRRIAVQNHKLEETIEMVNEKKMPIPSYTWLGLHPKANLTDEERATLSLWAESLMAQIAAIYPADSLVMKRR